MPAGATAATLQQAARQHGPRPQNRGDEKRDMAGKDGWVVLGRYLAV
jgi:hypothetical protein